jgi:hypothetical protein
MIEDLDHRHDREHEPDRVASGAERLLLAVGPLSLDEGLSAGGRSSKLIGKRTRIFDEL